MLRAGSDGLPHRIDEGEGGEFSGKGKSLQLLNKPLTTYLMPKLKLLIEGNDTGVLK